jgi:hypothetical protein
MKIQWSWRISVLAVLVLVALGTNSPGQMPYGQPYGAPPQMVYSPAAASFAHDPGMVAQAMPYAVPASHYYGGPQTMSAMPADGYEQPTYGGGAASEDTGEYLLHDGYRHGPLGKYLASVLGMLAPYSETGCCAPHWFDIHAEAVFLRRDDDAQFRELVRLGPLGDAVITTSDLAFDTLDPSLRITGTWQTGPGSNLEFTYFGLNDYSEKVEARSSADLLYAVFDNFSLDANGVPVAANEIEQFHQAEYQRVKLDSDFDSLELNYRRRWMGPTCLVQGSWLIGVRYFDLQDRLTFYSFADRDVNLPPGEDSGGDALYDLRTRNYMTGAQLGGDMWLCLTPGLRLGIDGKAGLFGNNVKVNTALDGHDPYDNFVAFIAPEALGNDKVTFIGEMSLLLTYQINHNFTFRGGYQMMWLEGVATALDNFNPDITQRIPMMADGGSLFYNGFTVGAEWMW